MKFLAMPLISVELPFMGILLSCRVAVVVAVVMLVAMVTLVAVVITKHI